jgi:putative phosphoesterase
MSGASNLQAILTDRRSFPCPLAIGVLSDTHVWANGRRTLPAEVPSLFRRFGVGLILHAGDINDDAVLSILSPVAPLIAVYGNNDSAELRSILAIRETLHAGNHRIGLIHGHGGRSAREVAFGAFPEPCDLVVYGHSHIPKIEQRGGTVYFNPGSPTDRRWGPHFGIGLIHCDARSLHPELILFSKAADLESVTSSSVKLDAI